MEKHYAKGPFQYVGEQVHRGQILEELKGTPNDDRLIGLGYLLPFRSSDFPTTYKCDDCQRRFVTESFYTAHKKLSCAVGCNADGGDFTNRELAEMAGIKESNIKDPKDVHVNMSGIKM